MGVDFGADLLRGGEFTMDYAEPPYELKPVTTIAWQGMRGLLRRRCGSLMRSTGSGQMAKKMLYANIELIHHGAEICLLRDLYLRLGVGSIVGSSWQG